MVKVNGEELDIVGMTIAEFVKQSEFNTTRIAVERNEEFVPRAKYAETVLEDGDSLEVVSFVGGG